MNQYLKLVANSTRLLVTLLLLLLCEVGPSQTSPLLQHGRRVSVRYLLQMRLLVVGSTRDLHKIHLFESKKYHIFRLPVIT